MRRLILPLCVFLAASQLSLLFGAERVALVIGNGKYVHVAKLENPPRDARAVGETLKGLGFQVIQAEDTTVEQFYESLETLKTEAAGAKLALIYFAGHGIEIEGRNYLLPVDAELAHPGQLRTQAIALEAILGDMEATGVAAKLAILDCCRNDPLTRAWMSKRSLGGRGLAELRDAQIPGATMVMFSAGPGQVAMDGVGRNSPFTEAFVRRLQIPGQNLFEAFLGTSDDVTKATARRQEPWVKFDGAGRLFRELVIAPKDSDSSFKPPLQAGTDISSDPKTVLGKLPNGFRYIVYPNVEPPKRVSMRLHVAAGSLMEADDQQGLAHFLEHMVFNGSKNFTSAELIPKMQRLGIAFGAHANAYTSFDETLYMLDLPDLSKDTLDLGFTVMRDFGDGAKLEADEIDKERGVILSEKMSRDYVDYRLMEQQYQKFLPGSLVAKRFPIGTEDVIKSAARERFTDFYTRYYTPERMTFVVVGDIDPAEIAKRVEAVFGDMKNPAEAGKNPDMGPIKSPEGIETSVFADKEVESTELSLTLIRPYVRKPDTFANRTERISLDLAYSIITRRFEKLAEGSNSPITLGSAGTTDLLNYLELSSIKVTAARNRWQEAVPVLEHEFRRALEHGFTEAELSEAKASLINAYEQAVKDNLMRKSEELASSLAHMINDDKVFSTPETDLEIARKALGSLGLDGIHQRFKKFWYAPGYHLSLITREKPEGAEGTLAVLYQEAIGQPVEAPSH